MRLKTALLWVMMNVLIAAHCLQNILIHNGPSVARRKGKRKKKPMHPKMRSVIVFCGTLIKLTIAGAVLYLAWLIYVAIYEQFFWN